MVKDFIQRFSGGADGVNITGANSGSGTSGDPFTVIIKNSGTDVTATGDACFQYSAAAALEGATGAKMSSAGITGNTYGSWTVPAGNGKRAVFRVPLNFPAAPGATHIIGRFSSASSFFQLLLQTNRTLQAVNGSGGGIVASNSTALSVNTQYWIEFAVTIGTTTSNGVLEYKVFTNSKTDGTGVDTLVFSWSSGATLNTGTDADMASVRFHIPLATSGWTSLNTDLWRARFTSVTTDWLGPYVSTLPPTGAGSQTVGRVRLTAIASGGTSPYSYGITHMSGPSITSQAVPVPNNDNMWEVPIPTSADDVWQVIITDDTGTPADPISYTVAKAVGGAPAIYEAEWSATSSTWVTL